MKPDSKESLNNVAFVDSGIRNITKVFDSFYGNDGKTSYIVTSEDGDHMGLVNLWKLKLSFIGWGSGIKKSNHRNIVNGDPQSKIWWLEDYERHDMAQVDLAPLMSFLIGMINFSNLFYLKSSKKNVDMLCFHHL